MDTGRWRKLETVFATAADLPPAVRKSYLDEACADDAELREEVESMLAEDSQILAAPEKSLRSVIAANASILAMDRDSADPLLGTFLGPYRVVALLGRGGMGAVYRAIREDDQFRKEVAIKVIPRLLAGPDAIARFRAERQILANLEHPNIARLLDGGASQGTPYLVMEFIEGGVPITDYVTAKALSLEERLALIRSVCAAVQYAHSNFVVHRDLKPANILVSADGVVKLLDFGIAKMMDTRHDTPNPQTSAQMITPDFASPEQIRGEPVTTSTDVYSLGIVMYEVLTGVRPYRASGQSPLEMERLICHTEPRRPSEVDTAPRRMRRNLSGDLDNIVLMALRKDPGRRYQSPEHLAADIQRYREGLPVHARPDTLAYRTGKFLHRNRWPVTAGLLVAASLLAGTVVSVREARAARNRFNQLRGFAQTILVDLDGQLSDIPGTGRARQALTAHVSDYLRRIAAGNASGDAALATEIATTYLRLSEIQGTTPEALASLENGRKLLEAKRANGKTEPADVLMLGRLRLRIGSTLADLGRSGEAREHLLAAAALAKESGAAGSVEAVKIEARADWRLARILRVQYSLSEAEQHSRAAVAACAKAMRETKPGASLDRELEEIHNGARLVLGGVLRRQGKWDQSVAMYLSVLADNERRAAANPGSVQMARELARTHSLLADLLSLSPGREAEVHEHVTKAIAIAERLAAVDPQDKVAQSELGQYHSLAAEALTRPEDLPQVERSLRRALPIFKSLLQREPESGTFLLYAGLTEAELGDCMGGKRPAPESLQLVRNGVAQIQKLVNRDPRDTTNRIELLKLQRMLVRNLVRGGHAKEALELSNAILAQAREVSGEQGSQTELPMRELPRAYALLGSVYQQLGRPEESQNWYRMSLDQWDRLKAQGYELRDAEKDIRETRKAASLR